MNIDPKHASLKNFISDNTSGNNNTKMANGHSLISTAEQKLLDFELKNENEKSDTRKKKNGLKNHKENKENKEMPKTIESKEPIKDKTIERDPLKLLKLF